MIDMYEIPALLLFKHGYIVKRVSSDDEWCSDGSIAYGIYHNGSQLFNMKLPSNSTRYDAEAYAVDFLRSRKYLPVTKKRI